MDRRRREGYNDRPMRHHSERYQQRDRRYNEEPAFSPNYRRNHLYPREQRGFRDERNYMREYRNYAYPDRRVRYQRERYDNRYNGPLIPKKEEMDAMLAAYLEQKD